MLKHLIYIEQRSWLTSISLDIKQNNNSMTKPQLTLISLLLAITIFAQNNLYVVYDTSTFVSKSKSTLLASKTQSIYEDGFISSDNKDGDLGNNSFNFGGFNKSKISQNINHPNLVYLQVFKNNNQESNITKDYKIIDEMPEMNWVINDKKPLIEILGYPCQEATLEFRGSKFVAYFTHEIPTTFGPWKFHGLPGLILEVKSLDNPNIYWIAEKIIYPYKEEFVDESTTISFDYTMKEYVSEIDDIILRYGKAIKAKTGSNFELSKPHEKRKMLVERKYEWETW